MNTGDKDVCRRLILHYLVYFDLGFWTHFKHFQCFLWVEFQITLGGNFSGIRGALWGFVYHKTSSAYFEHDYLTLRCFMLSVSSEPISKKRLQKIALKFPKLATNLQIQIQD